ncbi:MAG: flagellar basal body L-ring protein FlgH [Pseudomonadota bacterium]
MLSAPTASGAPSLRCAWPLILVIALLAVGCTDRLDHLGKPPSVSAAMTPERIATPLPTPERLALAAPEPVYARVPRAAGLPAPLPDAAYDPGALRPGWQSNPGWLLGGRRARRRGDILTVVIETDDEAEISNTTGRSRSGDENVNISALLGLPAIADVILPGGSTLNPAVNLGSTTSTQGTGSVSREEEITLRLAATVVDVLPNGHLVIQGSQEVLINFELRDLQITGIVRPLDINRTNEVPLERIADARVKYGGRGQLSDVQQPRYGQQVLDILSPF